MDQEEREMKIIELLYKISLKLDKLDEIVSLLHMGQMSLIEERKNSIFESSKLSKMVYDLCDGKHTVSEIAKVLGKSISSISQIIAKLLEEKLIIEERLGKEKYYKRLV